RSEVLPRVALRGARLTELDVVLEEELLRGGHRGLRLVDVRALGEREEPRDALGDLSAMWIDAGLFVLRVRHARRLRVDAEPLAERAELRTVRGLVVLSQDLAHVLVRHLVLEHLDDDAP